MFKYPVALALAGSFVFPALAHAAIGASADLGTTGAGVHVVVPMESYLNGRFGVNYLKHDFDKTSGSVDYTLKGKLHTVDVLFDWYLRENSSFHLTGGLVYNGSKFDAVANPNRDGSFTLNGKEYGAADVGVLTGKVDFRKAAPYFGIGWGNALAPAKHWHFFADLGAFYQGKPNVNLASVGCTTSNQVCGALAGDVAAERAKLQQDADAYKVYPVLRASLAYRF